MKITTPPAILNPEVRHLPSAIWRSFMAAAVPWRSGISSRLLVPSLPHAAPGSIGSLSKLGLHSSAFGKLWMRFAGLAQVKPTFASASFVSMAAFSSPAAKSLNGGAACRDTDRNGTIVEQGSESWGVSSVAPRSVGFSNTTVEHGSDFVLDTVGSIDVIVGPMFAGKTTALLQRVRKEVDAGRKASLVKSDKDNRYAVSAVVSHDGVKMPCVAVPNLASFRERVGEETYRQIEVIGIDEAQFFDDLLEFCQSAAEFDHKTIIVAGLDGDFLRRRFGFVLDLIPLADSVTKLHARCELCNQPASFTFRKTVNIETEVIGGVDVYMPVCRQHFVSEQNAVDTARSVLHVHHEPRRATSSAADDLEVKALQTTNSRAA